MIVLFSVNFIVKVYLSKLSDFDVQILGLLTRVLLDQNKSKFKFPVKSTFENVPLPIQILGIWDTE